MTTPVPPEAITAAARPVCEHYWAFHLHDGLSVRLCQLCHEPDWDDIRSELAEARAEGAAAERDRWREQVIGYKIGGKLYHPADITIVLRDEP